MSNARLILNAILTAFACATIIPPAPIPPASIGNPPAPTPQLVMPPAPRADQFPTPPAPRVAPAPKSETKAAPRPQPRIVRPTPVAPSQPAETQPAETQQVTPAAAGATGPAPDLAYGAYQRGYYLSAFNTATVRQQLGDTKAMTLLGEICTAREAACLMICVTSAAVSCAAAEETTKNTGRNNASVREIIQQS